MSKLDYKIEEKINTHTLAGIGLIIIGSISVIFPYFFTRAIVYIVGAVLLIAGFALGFLYLTTKGERKSVMVKGLGLMALGLMSLMCPVLGAKAFTIVLMLFFFFSAITNFILARSIKSQAGASAAILTGILSLLLDALIIMGWQETTQFFIGVFVGVLFIADGMVFILVGKVEE